MYLIFDVSMLNELAMVIENLIWSAQVANLLPGVLFPNTLMVMFSLGL